MKIESYCSLLCARTDAHTHPAIPAELAPRLRAAAKSGDVRYDDLLRRMAEIVATRIRARPDGRRWLDLNGNPMGKPVPVSRLADKTLNPRRKMRGAAYFVGWTLLTVEVVEKCEHGTLSEVLSSLESSSRP